MTQIYVGHYVEDWPTPRCGRLDRHAEHGTCPGQVTVEGGSLDTHDCGARVHPSEVRECCSRCAGSICPECAPCRRVS